MKTFAELVLGLESDPDREARRHRLTQYLADARTSECETAIALLRDGRLMPALEPQALVSAMAAHTGFGAELIEACLAKTGDAAELSGLVEMPTRDQPMTLTQFCQRWAEQPGIEALTRQWLGAPPSARAIASALVCGGLAYRPGADVLVPAIQRGLGLNHDDARAYLRGAQPPSRSNQQQ